MNSLCLHIKYKDNSEEAEFIPLNKFSLTKVDNKLRLQIDREIKTKEDDPFFVLLTYTNDPYTKPKTLIINLGYIVLRVRLTMGKVISARPFIYETECLDNFLFQWKLPLRMPTKFNTFKYNSINLAERGYTHFEWTLNGWTEEVLLNYTIYIPKEKKGYRLALNGDMSSLWNGMRVLEEKELQRQPKVFKL
jgi:hypothetical protein